MNTLSAVLFAALLAVTAAAAAPQMIVEEDGEVTPYPPCSSVDCSDSHPRQLCAFDPHRGFMSFDSNCLMDKENSCNCGTYGFKHFGACTDEEIGVFQLKLAQNPRECVSSAHA